MTNEPITNKDLYDAINDLRKEMSYRIDAIEKQVDENTGWRNKMVGQFTMLMIIIGGAVNYIWDSIFNRT